MSDEQKEKKQSNFIIGIFLGLIVFASLMYVARQIDDPKRNEVVVPATPTHTPGVNEYNADGTVTDTTEAAIEAMTATPQDPVSSWEYESDTDKMGNTSKSASVKSKDLIFFDSPYSGGSTARLVVRKEGGRLDIYVTVRPSQMNLYSDYDGRNNINVRFDEDKQVVWKYNQAADNSSDILFINSEKRFLERLKKSKKVVIEILFYTQGTRQIEFITEGLKW